MFSFIAAIVIFVAVYFFIAIDKGHKTVIALLGAIAMILVKVLDQKTAFSYIDFNTIFLLLGMMIIVTIMQRTGIFQYLAVKSVKISKGNPVAIMILLGAVTAVVSAFLDNVTTILLIVPVSLVITDTLGLHPIPFIMVEILASNIGGATTLIGDPPNMMIGSASGLSFLQFVINLLPAGVLALGAFLLTARVIYRRELYILPELKDVLLEFDEKKAITDWNLTKKSLWAFGLTVCGFLVHHKLGLEPATIAIAGAFLLMAISRVRPEDIFKELDWSAIFFFIGLFIIVGGAVQVGLVDRFTEWFLAVTKENLAATALLLLWGSAILSSVIGSLSITVALIPLVRHLGLYMPVEPLWWALALGACFGGNGTLIGAGVNVIAAGITKEHGYPIRFFDFMKYGMPLMIQSMVIAMAYIYVRYLM